MNLQERTREIAAARLRRTLYWIKKPYDSPEMQMGIQVVITQQYWKDWGYPRLFDCLMGEFHIPEDPATKITIEAIDNGYEEKQRYRTNAKASSATD